MGEIQGFKHGFVIPLGISMVFRKGGHVLPIYHYKIGNTNPLT